MKNRGSICSNVTCRLPGLANGWLYFFTYLTLGYLGLSAESEEVDVWVGTGQNGIYHLKLDTKEGVLSQPRPVSDLKGAGFLALHPTEDILYATSRGKAGGVTAFAVVSNGKDSVENIGPQLKQLGTLTTGDGGAACVAVDKTGKVLATAQYGGGSVSTFLLNEQGDLDRRVETIEHGEGSRVHPKRQVSAHPHWVGTSPDNRFLMVPDLGMDRVFVYGLDSNTGQLKLKSKVPLPPGSGPRHMKFHPSGAYAFVLNELTLTLSVFRYDPSNASLKARTVVATLPPALKDKHLNSAAEIRVHPKGRFVYASNRGHDSIAVFSFDEDTGELRLIERESIRGAWPRNFNIDPTGKWLIAAGQRSNTLALFEIDQVTGELVFTRQLVNLPAPICVLFESE